MPTPCMSEEGVEVKRCLECGARVESSHRLSVGDTPHELWLTADTAASRIRALGNATSMTAPRNILKKLEGPGPWASGLAEGVGYAKDIGLFRNLGMAAGGRMPARREVTLGD